MTKTAVSEKAEAMAFLTREAAKQGKTLQEFIDTDIRELLESAWHIQKMTGKPVSIDDLVKMMNGDCKE